MLDRRKFLANTLKGSTLIAMGPVVPGFLVAAARAATPGADKILVVLEMAGGNDGLNTVIPYADDAYQKARPTLRFSKQEVVRIDDHLGINPGMRAFDELLSRNELAILQGVGYPNPNRSHFESMDIWQSADLENQSGTGWLGRSVERLHVAQGKIPGMYVGGGELPLALHGSPMGIPSIHPGKPYDLSLGASSDKDRSARRKLIQEVTEQSPGADGGLLQFVKRSALETYASVDRLRDVMRDSRSDLRFYSGPGQGGGAGGLAEKFSLVGRMIQAGFGARLFYVSIGGFDTHSNQRQAHQELLQQVANSVRGFFQQLRDSGNASRVLVMTFSEFGRRVDENGSRGTDHGAASCLFVAGPAVRGGVVGKHPSLTDLGDGDLKYHTDFRQVYATLLDDWLSCDSERVLGARFKRLPLVRNA